MITGVTPLADLPPAESDSDSEWHSVAFTTGSNPRALPRAHGQLSDDGAPPAPGLQGPMVNCPTMARPPAAPGPAPGRRKSSETPVAKLP
jgi:hypothetical protein